MTQHAAPPAAPPDLRCPDCRAPLSGEPACRACGLALTGPAAQRLWAVDVALAALDGQRAPLLVERAGLLAGLRAAAGSPSQPPVPVASSAPEAAPRSVQNVLLGLGVLLLVVAATVFAAVTYERLGAGGRAAVLLALTAAAAGSAPALLRRRLSASAEAASAVALALAALDAYGLRTLGLGDRLSGTAYAASCAAVLAALALVYARVVPLRTAAVAAPVLGHLAALLAVAALEAGAGTAAVVLVALAGADLLLVLLPARPVLRPPVGRALVVLGLGAATAGLLTAALGIALEDRAAPLALLLLAGLCAAAALQVDRRLRELLTAAPVPLVTTAAWGLVRPHLDAGSEPLVAAGTALLAALAAAVLPALWRRGPLLGSVAVAGAAALTQADAVLQALLGPAGWLLEPWARQADGARATVSPLQQAWDGTAVAPVAVGVLAVVLLRVGLALRRPRVGLLLAAAPAAATVVLVPLGLATSYAVALAVLLAAVAATVSVGLRTVDRTLRSGLLTGAAACGLLVATWSLADRTATLLVLPVLTALALATAARRGRDAAVATAATGLLAAASLAAGGAARGLAAEQVGAVLVFVVAVAMGAAALLAAPRRRGAEVAAALLAALALLLASADPGWLSWCLAGTGLVALGGALRADRRALAPAGALLLAASSWVRLAEAAVEAPEPYVVPLGLLALALGHLRRRQVPATGSLAAYGTGLSALLVPGLLAALDGDGLLRPLLLGFAALAVLLVGARTRLKAPLALGGAVLAVDALHLLAPYTLALPRWLPLALAGLLLVGLGATYEQRRRDLGRLRDRFTAMG